MTSKGITRFINDALVIIGIPLFLQKYPYSLLDFIKLSSSSTSINTKTRTSTSTSRTRTKRTKICYGHGNHKSQCIDLVEPRHNPSGVVVFVHGGAWGSGMPWMYRLLALPFLQQELNLAVAFVGYRTYPDADVQGQIKDVKSAIEQLAKARPDLLSNNNDNNNKKNKRKKSIEALIGHSSGAHITLQHILDELNKQQTTDNDHDHDHDPISIKRYVGLSGVYDIPLHYQFEKGRGLDQISPLRVACAGSNSKNQNNVTLGPSPRYHQLLTQHDDTVSYQQTCDMVDSFRTSHYYLSKQQKQNRPQRKNQKQNQTINTKNETTNIVHAPIVDLDLDLDVDKVLDIREYLLENVGHVDTVIQLMVDNGPTRDVIVNLFK
ncbi:alpha/beta-hydrolase [Fragilariopsis cylindrus CCMP1102]|uniref:Alpha/beta-hydrolase n=1 Tax=Fragilariopsis cylindrus CCMP1102 TaxID=635003 RepID=A0A1E7EWH0_9STRA|nr:alpha/beta-hydrolase [Fragilariopsis cylindrus CCMP1102]|eukprot:OEU10378.1 alpha/beta-hydrolase [Fragilariopsis cylindrus CCMP1102]